MLPYLKIFLRILILASSSNERDIQSNMTRYIQSEHILYNLQIYNTTKNIYSFVKPTLTCLKDIDMGSNTSKNVDETTSTLEEVWTREIYHTEKTMWVWGQHYSSLSAF